MTPECSLLTPSTPLIEVKTSQEAASTNVAPSQSPITSEVSLASSLRADSEEPHENVFKVAHEPIPQNRSASFMQLNWAAEQSPFSQLTLEFEELKSQRSRLVSELEVMNQSKSHLIWEVESLKTQKADEIQYWKDLYRGTEKKRKALKRRNKHMQAEIVIRGQDAVRNTDEKLRGEVDLLKERLASYKATSKFKTPFGEDLRAENAQKVDDDLKMLVLKLNKLLQGQDALFSIKEMDFTEQHGLSILLRRSFDCDSKDNVDHITPTRSLCGINLRALVLSLVSAALCTWVFESDVAVLFQENNHAYWKIRSLLAAQGK